MQIMRAPLQGTKRKDGRWQIIVTLTREDGAKIRKTIIKARLEDAQNDAHQLIATTARRAEFSHSMQELIDAYKAERWAKPVDAGGLSQGAKDQHRPAYRRIVKWFDGVEYVETPGERPVRKVDRDIRDIEAPEVSRWIRAMESDPRLGGRSVQAYRNVLSVLFSYGEELGWCSGNPAKGRTLRGSAKPKKRPRLSEERFRAIVANERKTNPHLADLWQFLGETGMRIGAREGGALKLRRENIFRSLDLWWIRGGEKTEAGKDREVPLSDDLANRLIEQEGWLFPKVLPRRKNEETAPSPEAYNYRHVVDLWADVCKRADVEYTPPHQLRKLAISRWIHSGLPDDVTTALAGHASIVITQDLYNRLGRDRLMNSICGTEYVSGMSKQAEGEERNPLL